MIMTKEEHNKYSRCGRFLQLEVEKDIGRLLLDERLKRGLRVDEIGNPAAMQANVPQPGRRSVPPPKPEASKYCLLI